MTILTVFECFWPFFSIFFSVFFTVFDRFLLFGTVCDRFTESIHWKDDGWWMMDNGRKYRKYRKYTLMDDQRKYRKFRRYRKYRKYRMYRKYRKYTLMDDGWKYIKYRMRHFDETFWQDILMRHSYGTFWQDNLTTHIDGLWKSLITCTDLWYGDDFNGMALWQF